jgi:hypothetical protein
VIAEPSVDETQTLPRLPDKIAEARECRRWVKRLERDLRPSPTMNFAAAPSLYVTPLHLTWRHLCGFYSRLRA